LGFSEIKCINFVLKKTKKINKEKGKGFGVKRFLEYTFWNYFPTKNDKKKLKRNLGTNLQKSTGLYNSGIIF
jgi:hypothetical protein